MLADDLHQPIEDRRPAPGARGGEFLRQRLSIRWVTMVNSRLQLPDRFAISEALLRQRMICQRMVKPPSGVPKPPRRISLKASRLRPHSEPGIRTVEATLVTKVPLVMFRANASARWSMPVFYGDGDRKFTSLPHSRVDSR